MVLNYSSNFQGLRLSSSSPGGSSSNSEIRIRFESNFFSLVKTLLLMLSLNLEMQPETLKSILTKRETQVRKDPRFQVAYGF